MDAAASVPLRGEILEDRTIGTIVAAASVHQSAQLCCTEAWSLRPKAERCVMGLGNGASMALRSIFGLPLKAACGGCGSIRLISIFSTRRIQV